MWSRISPRVGRTGGAEKFRSSAEKDFFNSVDPTRTLAFARTARDAVKGRAEVTRFKGRFFELIVALIKLAALQVRLGTVATEAAWTFHSKVIQSIGAGDRPMQSAITEEKSMRLRVPLS
jgi:hypothetical protein